MKAQLSPQTTFLGFAGSPWTVATYMIAGQGSREQAEARQLAYADPGKMDAILDIVSRITVDYLSRPDRGRGRCGAIVRQLGGQPVAGAVRAMVIARTAWIVDQLKQRHPRRPIIGFPKGAGGKLRAYAAETGVDAIGLDETVDPDLGGTASCPPGMPVQGNLDPLALIAGGEPLQDAVAPHP